MMKIYKDEDDSRLHDIVETNEGILGIICSYFHPENALLISPKYIPVELMNKKVSDNLHKIEGRLFIRCDVSLQGRLDRYYQKPSDDLSPFLQVLKIYIKNIDENYLTVPLDKVKKVYRGKEGLTNLLSIPESKRDELQKVAIRIVKDLIANDVPSSNIGIVGSLLLGGQDPKKSDIDIALYGSKTFRDVMRIMRTYNIKGLKYFSQNEWESHFKNAGIINKLSPSQFARYMSFRFDRGSIDRIPFGFLAVRNRKEIQQLKRLVGRDVTVLEEKCIVEGVVIDDSEIMYMYPSIIDLRVEKWILAPSNIKMSNVVKIFNYSPPYIGLELLGKSIIIEGLIGHFGKDKSCVIIRPRTGSICLTSLHAVPDQ